MIATNSKHIENYGSYRVRKGFLYSLLSVFSTFLFFYASFASNIHEQFDDKYLLEGQCVTKVSSSPDYPYSFHLPELQPEGSTESDEKGLDDQLDDDGEAVYYTVEQRGEHFPPILFVGSRPHPHRRSIALFILFHAWKSDLT